MSIALFTDPIGAEATGIAEEPVPVLLLGVISRDEAGVSCLVCDDDGFMHLTGMQYVRLSYRQDGEGEWVDGEPPPDPDLAPFIRTDTGDRVEG